MFTAARRKTARLSKTQMMLAYLALHQQCHAGLSRLSTWETLQNFDSEIIRDSEHLRTPWTRGQYGQWGPLKSLKRQTCQLEDRHTADLRGQPGPGPAGSFPKTAMRAGRSRKSPGKATASASDEAIWSYMNHWNTKFEATKIKEVIELICLYWWPDRHHAQVSSERLAYWPCWPWSLPLDPLVKALLDRGARHCFRLCWSRLVYDYPRKSLE